MKTKCAAVARRSELEAVLRRVLPLEILTRWRPKGKRFTKCTLTGWLA